MAHSTIEWTEKVWNPVRGCSIVSPGCVNCYAMKQAHRFSGPGQPYEGLTKMTTAGPQWTGQIRLAEDKLFEPLSWRKPARVFVNSMSDLFHEDVPDQFIIDVFGIMALSPWHTYQVLTKRPQRMYEFLRAGDHGILAQFQAIQRGGGIGRREVFAALGVRRRDSIPWHWPLPNVWLGVSVENQEQADARIPLLLQTPAAVRWVSAEPLLGPVELAQLTEDPGDGYGDGAIYINALTGERWMKDGYEKEQPDTSRLNWVVVGGESGPGARDCRVAWVRSLVQQCREATVPVFVKQLGHRVIDRNDAGFMGEWPEAWPDFIDIKDRVEHDLDGTRDGYQGAPVRVHLRDRKGGDMSEWPADLRVREYPAEARA